MKKLIALFLALLLVTVLFGCVKDKQPDPSEDPGSEFQEPEYEEDDGNWSIVV